MEGKGEGDGQQGDEGGGGDERRGGERGEVSPEILDGGKGTGRGEGKGAEEPQVPLFILYVFVLTLKLLCGGFYSEPRGIA